jgi:hypothetical protein
MKQLNSSWMPAVAAAAAVAISAAQPLQAELLEKTKTVGGTTVHYKVVLPNGYDPAKAYPAILALGGGPQTMNTVDSVLTPQLPCGGREARVSRSLRRRPTGSCSSKTARASFQNF